MTAFTSALVGGFIGTMVLTTLARGASELGWTRMDLAFLLGTILTDRRRRAKAIGYALHFAFGVVFALVYAACFVALGRSGWWLGGLFGALHAVFVSTVVVNVLLPAVHPRMGTTSPSVGSRLKPTPVSSKGRFRRERTRFRLRRTLGRVRVRRCVRPRRQR
jgi:hypothetical protein